MPKTMSQSLRITGGPQNLTLNTPHKKKRDLPGKDQKKAVGIVTLPEKVAPCQADRRPFVAATVF